MKQGKPKKITKEGKVRGKAKWFCTVNLNVFGYHNTPHHKRLFLSSHIVHTKVNHINLLHNLMSFFDLHPHAQQ